MKRHLATLLAAFALLVQGYALAMPCGSDEGCCPPQDCAFACAIDVAPQPLATATAYVAVIVPTPELAVPALRPAHSHQALRPPIA